MTSSPVAKPVAKPQRRSLQAAPAKVFHWVNIISLFLMLTSGLQIYNANPVFGGREGFHFPFVGLLGGWLAGGRHWHFAAMWFFSLNLLWYGVYVLVTQRWKHRYVGGNDIKALQQSKNPKRRVYAWHRIVYTSIIPILLLALLSGVGMYKPAQFHWIVDFFGDWFALRVVHFLTVPTVIVFAIVHSLLALKAGGERLVDSMFLEE
ncbi:cytochrome b/b6 domain-containing protein [Stenomitos frigidus]|uniref:Thiosulfate reductase cytochrome B subunit (Membrane anchoring protein) n=1 Tax=Stenomitos frigidus ULC18 TaxID=2107698 RepID=A0A2T1DUU7_9CYAN|nr:cytochrome b/b6 domain-containing protein [Stenomitos frigidus]PSB24283.1 thiosulfate reductase cytochrome B subunit (membrane anchoring protein) [Stenomitos frigidus ULC18]